MTTFLVGVSSPNVSERLCNHLLNRTTPDDLVYLVHSLPGRDESEPEIIETGKEALAIGEEIIADYTVKTRQLIRGNDAATDLLKFALEQEVDELVIGARKRNPTGKILFGSTAQKVLLNANIPVWVIPRTADA